MPSPVTCAAVGIVEGDLEQWVEVNSRDELGRMAAAFQQMITHLKQMASTADRLAQGGLTADIEPKSERDIPGNALARMIAHLHQLVGQMSDNATNVARSSTQLTVIAAQTNLLALNAAIEAARAGEHGKGFVVVADEVRKLAEKSTTAPGEIADIIQTIQQSVTEAVTAMKDGAAEVESGVGRANEASQSLAGILKAVEALDDQVKEISLAAQHMSNSSKVLVRAMERVSAVVEENSAATEEMAASSNDVAQTVDNIARVSQENSITVEEVSFSIEKMGTQVQEVSTSAQTLDEMAQSLKEVVAQFKLNKVEIDKGSLPRLYAVQPRQGEHEPVLVNGNGYHI